MKDSVKVSIIVPVFNSQNFLKKCSESLLNQTYNNIEIIFVDDGSTDNSSELLRDIDDNRVTIISRENKGQLQSRIDGLNRASGEYVMFVDSDDWISENMIETMIEENKEYCADIVRCEYLDEHIEQNRSVRNRFPFLDNFYFDEKEKLKKEVFPIFFYNHMLNSMWGQLIKREFIENFTFDKSIRIGEDLLFNLQLCKKVNSILFVPQPLYHYRCNNQSITQVKNIDIVKKRINDIIYVYNKCYEWAIDVDINTDENIDNIVNTMLTKVNRCILDLYKIKTSKKSKVNICMYISELFSQYEISEKIQVKSLNLKNKLIYKKKYNVLFSINMLEIFFIYNPKEIVKKILHLLNRIKGM